MSFESVIFKKIEENKPKVMIAFGLFIVLVIAMVILFVFVIILPGNNEYSGPKIVLPTVIIGIVGIITAMTLGYLTYTLGIRSVKNLLIGKFNAFIANKTDNIANNSDMDVDLKNELADIREQLAVAKAQLEEKSQPSEENSQLY
jgi:hypothetical protein